MLGSKKQLSYRQEGLRQRASSYDRAGGNDDYIILNPGKTITIAKLEGAGCIQHIWMTDGSDEVFILRKLVLRMYWDDEQNPSVEVPLGESYQTLFLYRLCKLCFIGFTLFAVSCLLESEFLY